MGRKAQKNDSLPGSLDMLILRTLSLRDLHGYGIVQFIQQSSDNELLVEEGSLYPALQRLELNGWADGVWGVTSNNRRLKLGNTRNSRWRSPVWWERSDGHVTAAEVLIRPEVGRHTLLRNQA